MLPPADLARMVGLLRGGASRQELRLATQEIRLRLNPHPGGQVDLNVPVHDGVTLAGVRGSALNDW